MIAFLRGVVFQYNPESIIIDVNGIGYEVQVHSRSISSFPPPGGQVLVHTYLQVTDNEFKLYGFAQRDELELFKTLIGISGIGARAALNILAAGEPGQFYQAIASGDEKRLQSIPGIGKKTAGRLIFELKDKIARPLSALEAADDNSLTDVMEALEALGYSRSEVFPLYLQMKERGELSTRLEENVKLILKKKASLLKR